MTAAIEVERTYQLGGSSIFRASSAAHFARRVFADRRASAASGDLQGVGYAVASAEDARALGAEDTTSGWYVRDLELVLEVTS